MGIGAQELPRGRILQRCLGHAPPLDIPVLGRVFQEVAVRIRDGVLPPLGLGGERNALFVKFGEGLQARNIRSKGEFPISYTERAERIRPGHAREVPADELFTVYGTAPGLQAGNI
jgi:hypothetical protein